MPFYFSVRTAFNVKYQRPQITLAPTNRICISYLIKSLAICFYFSLVLVQLSYQKSNLLFPLVLPYPSKSPQGHKMTATPLDTVIIFQSKINGSEK